MTELKGRMRESKGAGVARLFAVSLRVAASVIAGVAALLLTIEKVARESADALMITIAIEKD